MLHTLWWVTTETPFKSRGRGCTPPHPYPSGGCTSLLLTANLSAGAWMKVEFLPPSPYWNHAAVLIRALDSITQSPPFPLPCEGKHYRVEVMQGFLIHPLTVHQLFTENLVYAGYCGG